jgi:hypothetical protein
MTSTMDASKFLQLIQHEFDWHVRQHKGAEAYRAPSLTNSILPMFALDRWATGPGQDTRQLYPIMRPALQLASLWLTEDMPLLWFGHLTFGQRRRNAAGQVYLERNPHYSTPAALATVRTNLHEFGKTNFFSFAHPDCKDQAYGTTYPYREMLPYFRKFRHTDFPPVLSSKGVLKPCIRLTRAFVKSFQSPSVSANERYRSLFMFAIVLCHEVAHGYHMFLDSSPEPLWAVDEKIPELGFSWELNVLGHVPMPNGGTGSEGRFRRLNAVRMLELPPDAERDRVLLGLKGTSRAEFTTRDASGNYRNWPILNGGRFRGAEWTLSRHALFFIASFHDIPTHWMVSWFQRDSWEALKLRWLENNRFVPPALGQTFMIIYERTPLGVQIHRPLYPNNPIDAKIIEEHHKYLQR